MKSLLCQVCAGWRNIKNTKQKTAHDDISVTQRDMCLLAPVLQRQCPELQQQAPGIPGGDLREHAQVREARLLRDRRGFPRGPQGSVLNHRCSN